MLRAVAHPRHSRAWTHPQAPAFAPLQVQFEFGWLVDNRAYDQHGTGISAATGVHCQFRSPVFDVENVDELQVFYLPRPTLVAGGHVTVKLIGKVQYTLPNACCLPVSTVLLLPPIVLCLPVLPTGGASIAH